MIENSHSPRIYQKIQTFYIKMREHGNDRGHSWEHCYEFFQKTGPDQLRNNRDQASLHLGFYLASWGMYRGSSFLQQFDFRVHNNFVDLITDPCFTVLWSKDFGSEPSDSQYISTILKLVNEIKAIYRPFAKYAKKHEASDTLTTKIILGTIGCLPACDRLFRDGFKSENFKFNTVNETFITDILAFSQNNLQALKDVQDFINNQSVVAYPLMKLVDMYFWQLGFELEKNQRQTNKK